MNKLIIGFSILFLVFVFIFDSSVFYNVPLTRKNAKALVIKVKQNGGSLSYRKMILLSLSIFLFCFGVGVIYQLNQLACFFLFLLSLFVFPSLYLFSLQFEYQRNCCQNYIFFVRTFIEEFTRYHKLYFTLQEMKSFPVLLEEVKIDFEQISDIQLIYEKLLNLYPHYLLKNTFTLAYCCEKEGFVDIDLALERMSKQLQEYEQDMLAYYSQIKMMRNRIVILTLMAMLIAYSSRFMLFQLPVESTKSVYQLSIFCFLLLCLLILLVAYKSACIKYNSFEEAI